MVAESPEKPKGFFPKKGWRKVDGVWVAPTPLATKRSGQGTPKDRRDWARRMAGWPVKGN